MYDRKRFYELCKEDGVPLMPSSGKLKIILDGTLCDITEDNVRKLLFEWEELNQQPSSESCPE